MALSGYSIVRVFTATRAYDRERLGDQVTAWLAARPELAVVSTVVTQSSDTRFHCQSIVLFCKVRS